MVISEMVTRFSLPASLTCIEKARVEPDFWGCADAWQDVGSMESKLSSQSAMSPLSLSLWLTLFPESRGNMRPYYWRFAPIEL